MRFENKPLLITTSLLDDFAWLEKAPNTYPKDSKLTWKQLAFKRFNEAITRTGVWNPTPAIERGIKFEKRVNNYLHLSKEAFQNAFIPPHCARVVEFWDKGHGAIQQKVTKKVIVVAEQEYLLYGKIDLRTDALSIDIKTTGNYRGSSSYTEKGQHLVYAYCENESRFEYIVAVFDDDTGTCIDVISIPIQVDLADAEKEITRRITETMSFIANDKEMLNAYLHTFNRF